MSRSSKLATFLSTWIVYAALTGEIILSMSGALWLIFPLLLPLNPLMRWFGLNRAGFLPIRGMPAQDIVVPIIITFGFAITIVGLVQIVKGAKRKCLVTNGLYATMRHPQHLGIALWALGFALWGSNILDFLKDVQVYRQSGIAERYKRLGISVRQGQGLKTKLAEIGLIEQEEIRNQKGRLRSIRLTKSGEKFLENNSGKS